MPRPHLPPDPDKDLVTRARTGDTAAFDTLVLRYGRQLRVLVHQMTSNMEDAEDLLQEVFARAYQSLDGFRGESSFKTWIRRIAVNHALNFLRRRNRVSGAVSLTDEVCEARQLLFESGSRAADPGRQAGLHELQTALGEAMGKLSAAHRRVVMMFDIGGMTHGEIAALLKTSEGTIRSRLHYAHLKLRSSLEDAWNERFCGN
jgi:RNA polymerase sigma factor (sigma-70 family)